MYISIFIASLYNFFAHKLCGLGKYLPFCLLHDTLLESFGAVTLFDIDCLLEDYLTAIGNLVDEVNRCAGDFDSVAQGFLVYSQTVESLAAEGGDQRGVDIENPLGIARGKPMGQDGDE